MTPPTCRVCDGPCGPADRNTDGTYAHLDCLRGQMTRPPKAPEK